MLLFAFIGSAQDFSMAKKRTEELFYEELDNKGVNNAFLSVYSPSKNIDWNFVDGKFKNGRSVTSANPFYTASIGKTFTATSIAILYEQGKLNFSDPLAKYLSDHIINGLHVFEGNEYSQEITIAQLLQHTSGLPDYFEGETIDGSPNGMGYLFMDTDRFWQPLELVKLAKGQLQVHKKLVAER